MIFWLLTCKFYQYQMISQWIIVMAANQFRLNHFLYLQKALMVKNTVHIFPIFCKKFDGIFFISIVLF